MKNILVITYWSYKDALIQTYTLPYLYLIKKSVPSNTKIFLFTLEQFSYRMTQEEWNTEKEKLSHKKIFLIRFKYSRFGLKMLIKASLIINYLIFLIFREGISHIHSWCTPAGTLALVLSKITRKKLIIDSFEPHALPMVEGGIWSKKSIAFRLLNKFEQLQAKYANVVIGCVNQMKEYTIKTYKVNIKQFYHIPACVNFNKFDIAKRKNSKLLKELGLQNKIIGVYAGKFGGLYLEDEVFDFIKCCYDYYGDNFRFLLLTNHSNKEILKYCAKANLKKEVIISMFVPHSLISNYIGLADFGITPTKPSPSRRYSTPIKTAEYWALGLPVVITENISDDSEIIKTYKIGSIMNDFSKEGYFRNIKEIDNLLKIDNKKLKEKILLVAKKYRSFDIAKNVYQAIYPE